MKSIISYISKYLILIVLFCFIKVNSQTDTGLTYKSFAYVSAAKGGNIQIIDNLSQSFHGSIGIISANTNYRNSGRTLGISKDGQLLFQDSYGLSTTTQIISLATNTIVSGINFSNSGGMIYSPDENTIYTSPSYYILKYNINDQTISTFISRNTGTCNSTNPNEAYTAGRMAISSNGNNLYVGNLDPRKKGISVYDTTNGTEVKIHSGISGVQKLNISPDDAFVYLCNTSWGYGACTNDPSLMIDIYGNNTNHSSDIAILNTSTNAIVDYLNLGSISDVVVSNDGTKIYVGTSTGVKVIDRDLSSNIHTISSENYVTGAVSHLGLEPSGNFIYVVTLNILKVINLSNGTISTISTTSESNKSLGNIVFSSYYTPPIGLSVSTNSTNNNSNLNWTAVASPNLANYKIYGGTSLSNLQVIGSVSAGTENYIHTGLSEGVTYYYKIAAVGINNIESNKSSAVMTTTATLTPIITGPNSATGVSSSVSMNENTAAVHTFSANKTVSWTLGNGNDEALFSIDNTGNLVFITAPDFETPSSTLNSNTYVVDVIATDAASNATSQTLTITILDIPNSTFGAFATITKQYFTGTHTIVPPTTNNTNPITYTSDNTAVATISGSVITFTGVGTANITASQAADANYEGNAIATVLTVLGKDLVSKYGGISSTDLNYISANGSLGGAIGLDKYGNTYRVFESRPDAPIISSVTTGNTQASISFTAPANTGGSTITSYTATSNPGGISGTISQAGSGSITVTGLTNGTAYTFTVTATNNVGTSAASTPSASVRPGITYTILDQYTNRVPTGTSYTDNTEYNEYIDAGSVDASPFVITKLTSHVGGIVFYGTTELNSRENENTFRLTASTGNFDFISFNLNQLERNINGGDESLSTLPKITLTSSSGSTVSYEATVGSTYTFSDGSTYYSYNFVETGVKTLNWNNVEWVDIKTQYTKAHTKNFVLKKL